MRTGSTSEQKPCIASPSGASSHSSSRSVARPGSRSSQPAQSGPSGAALLQPGRQDHFLGFSAAPPVVESAAMNASWGTSTRPTIFIRFLPSFCFSSSLRLRVMSPP